MFEKISMKKLWGLLTAISFAFTNAWLTTKRPDLLITFSLPIILSVVVAYFGKQGVENLAKMKNGKSN